MKLREREMDPNVSRELEAIDAALGGRPVAAEHAELARFAADLAELSPQPGPELASELDAAVARGFGGASTNRGQAGEDVEGRPAGSRSRGASALARLRERIRGGPGPMPVIAGAASLLIAVAVSASILTSSTDRASEPGESLLAPQDEALQDGAPGAGAAESAPGSAGERSSADERLEATAQGATIEPSTAPAPAFVPPGDRPGREQRVQERSASLRLSTEPDELREVADGVVGATDRHLGFVESSNVATGEGSTQRATFALRVPAEELSPLLAELSELATVLSRNEGSVDVTAPFVSAEERFGDARAAVNRLLEELEDAGSASEIASLREQLRRARGELASARAQLRDLKQRAGFSRVEVVVVAEGQPGWSLDDAVDDAGSVLSSIAGAMLVALAALVPAAAIVALLWVASSGWRRRRRESGLD